MYQPQLVEVDLQRIQFNRYNPRKHRGEEYERLKQSIQEIGIIQPPIVRMIPGGFYEVIDGEGRVSAALDLNLPKIWVANMGTVESRDALERLMASNVVRAFNFIAECRGLAELHRQGSSSRRLASVLGETDRSLRDKIAIGYLPLEILSEPGGGPPGSEEQEQSFSWSINTLKIVLPLRQIISAKDPYASNRVEPQDEAYDYSEVKRAIEKVQASEIKTSAELIAYVEQRRRELFEERFNEELRSRIDSELEKTKQALEEANHKTVELQLQSAAEDIKRPLMNRISTLQAERDNLQREYTNTVREVAKHKDAQKLIDEYQRNLNATTQRMDRMRNEMEQEIEKRRRELLAKTQQELDRGRIELEKKIEWDLAEKRRKLDQDLINQRQTLMLEHKKTENDLKSYYAEKTKELEVTAKVGVRDSSAHGVELIAQLQQWLVHITSDDMIKGLSWLPQAEVIQLISSIRAVYGNLEEAEEKISHGKTVTADSENTVTSEPTRLIDERHVARW